jgi:hypothetical protein
MALVNPFSLNNLRRYDAQITKGQIDRLQVFSLREKTPIANLALRETGQIYFGQVHSVR